MREAMTLSTLRALIDGDAPIGDAARLLEQLRYHRLGPLAVDRWRDSEPHRELVTALRPDVVGRTAVDMRQYAGLRTALDALHAQQLDVLVVKGAALGALLYTSTAHRPRADLDLWVRDWGAVETAAAALEGLGYERVHALPGRLVPHAVAYRPSAGRPGPEFDLHARISRRHRVSQALRFDRVWADRREVVAHGCRFATSSVPWAWLHAALHLSTHHADQSPPAIMYEDLRRLSTRMSRGDWKTAWEVIVDGELVSAARMTCEQLQAWDPGAMDPGFVRALSVAPADASEAFASGIASILDDLLVLDADIGAYLTELLAPPDEYLYRHYGVARPRRASLLRALRLLKGAAQWVGSDLQG